VQLNALREQEAVHFMKFTGGYMVTRYDDVFRLLRDRSIGSTADNAVSSVIVMRPQTLSTFN